MTLPKPLTQRIEEIAAREGRSIESVVQTMLELYEQEEQRDPIEDFIGAFDDDVSDRSTTVHKPLHNL